MAFQAWKPGRPLAPQPAEAGAAAVLELAVALGHAELAAAANERLAVVAFVPAGAGIQLSEQGTQAWLSLAVAAERGCQWLHGVWQYQKHLPKSAALLALYGAVKQHGSHAGGGGGGGVAAAAAARVAVPEADVKAPASGGAAAAAAAKAHGKLGEEPHAQGDAQPRRARISQPAAHSEQSTERYLVTSSVAAAAVAAAASALAGAVVAMVLVVMKGASHEQASLQMQLQMQLRQTALLTLCQLVGHTAHGCDLCR